MSDPIDRHYRYSRPDASKPVYAIVLAETGQIKMWDGDLGSEYLAMDEDRARLELICDASRGEVIKEFSPNTLNEIEDLRLAARIWFEADGTPTVLASAEEVVKRRKEAAAEIERLRESQSVTHDVAACIAIQTERDRLRELRDHVLSHAEPHRDDCCIAHARRLATSGERPPHQCKYPDCPGGGM